MTPQLQSYIHAARVPETLAPQKFGDWRITRHEFPIVTPDVGFPSMTVLHHRAPPTEADMHLNDPHEVVMEDSARELRRHLPIWRAAYGRILVTGLGLGCVVRALLAKPAVEHIDVVEIDPLIFAVVGMPEFEGNPRITLHLADALTWRWPQGSRWDFAWHDLYVTRDADGYSNLPYLHFNLLYRFRPLCGQQGAWMLPRWIPRMARMRLLGSKKKTMRGQVVDRATGLPPSFGERR